MKILKFIYLFFSRYIMNYIIAFCPFLFIRKIYMKIFGVHLGKRSIIDMGYFILSPNKLHIGNHCHINHQCMLDARGKIVIGNNVSISHYVKLISAGHNYNSINFDYVEAPIIISDNVWIGINATILKGVTINEGAVIAAGAIVTKDCEPYGVYAGIPAKKIASRNPNYKYDCTHFAYYHNIRKPYWN